MDNSEYHKLPPARLRQTSVGIFPRLYIVEDNDENLQLYEWLFIRYFPDYTFHLFSDGLFLQEHLNNAPQKPDLILMDLTMPYISGLELLTRIKQDLNLKNIPVVIFTHSSSPGEEDACYKAGADGFVSKKISIKGIKEQMEEICQRWLSPKRLPI